MKGFFYLLKCIFLASVLAGCCVGPTYCPPAVNMPEEWHNSPIDGMETSPSIDNSNWWESLNDPILTWLIEQASEQNLDLFIAATRILEARAECKGKMGDYLPHIDGSFTAGHLYHNKKGILNQIIDCPSRKRNINFFEAGFDASWEIDLFGKTAHEVKALQAKIEAEEEAYCDLWLTLSAEIARNYIELRVLQKRLAILNEQICSQQDTLDLTNELIEIGSLSFVDLRQVEEQLFMLQAKKPTIEYSISKTIYRLSILLGYEPATLFENLCETSDLPEVPIYKPIGIPSDLLKRRPDVKRAERNLAAANEYIGSAIASLFPSFSLKGFIGNINSHLPSLFSPESYTLFIAPQILAPIFNSKMLQQDVYYNKLKAKEACFEYQKTVLRALEEAENAIGVFHSDLERSQMLSEALAASKEAYLLTLDLFERGIRSYLEVLNFNRAYLNTEEAYLQTEEALLFDYIALYKALGGGFSICE